MPDRRPEARATPKACYAGRTVMPQHRRRLPHEHPAGRHATAVVLVTIETRNRAPVAIATADWLIRGDGAGTIGTINGSASFDPDGDPITLIWRNVGNKAAEILDQGAERPRVRFTGGRGLYEFELEVVDDKGLRSFARESLIVGDP